MTECLAHEALRVLIVEDHPMVAERFARVLPQEDGLEVVGIAASAAEGLRRARTGRPHVMVVDQGLPDGSGTDLAQQLRTELPGTAVVIVSALDEEAVVADAVAAGCSGLVGKNRGAGELVRAVRAAAAGETFLSAEALRALATPKPAAPAPSGLTFREIEVLQCLADGLSNQAIAERLYLSPNTVGNHLQRAMAKLGAHSKLEALVIGVRRGLIALGGQCR